MNDYDIIIIGAGLSGLSIASELQNAKILLLDARSKPFRNIACAEWVPKLSQFAAFKISETEFMELRIKEDIIKNKAPGYVIDREKYQKTLLEQLKCSIHLGERVLSVDKNTVRTSHGVYKAKWIVGAYGPIGPINSKVDKNNFLPAINVRVPLKYTLKNTIIYFSEDFYLGYAWCFPRNCEANCGVGAKSKNLKSLLLKWLSILKKEGIIQNSNYKNATTGLIPLNVLNKPSYSMHILIGDAGGFTDPLTGAGIVNAIESAKLASQLIRGHIDKTKYNDLLETSYLAKYLKRRRERREFMENKWKNLKLAIKKSWMSFYRE